jgi:putative glutamine amidotransferase
MARRPVVLVTPDLDTRTGHRGAVDYLQVQRYYTTRVLDAGGLPLLPPPVATRNDADAILDQLIAAADAVVITGGGHDVDPRLYGEESLPACAAPLPERWDLELGLLRRAEARGLPVLGICGGMQLMNVARGGSLWQDLPTQRPGDVAHTMKGPKTRAAHDVVVVAGTRLAAITGHAGATLPLGVNSTHHQAVKALGDGLVVSAVAADGVVEAFEDPARRHHVGVQWHPEAMPDEPHRALYRDLIDAARTRR